MKRCLLLASLLLASSPAYAKFWINQDAMTDDKTAEAIVGYQEGWLKIRCKVGSQDPILVVMPGDLGVKGDEHVELQHRFDQRPVETLTWVNVITGVGLESTDYEFVRKDGRADIVHHLKPKFAAFVTQLVDAKRFVLELTTFAGQRYLVDIPLSNADRADLREAMRQCGTPLR
jgi:hypothetical protein